MFFAHSDQQHPGCLNGQNGAHWRILREHLQTVAAKAEKYASEALPNDPSFAAEAKLAGLLHDLGKYAEPFQQMLIDVANGKPKAAVRHAIHGAAVLNHFKAVEAAFAVCGHHAGLPSKAKLKSRLTPTVQNDANVFAMTARNDGVSLDDALAVHPKMQPMPPTRRDLRMRMLFSCLIDADRGDTAHMVEDHGELKGLEYAEPLRRFIAARAAETPDGQVKRARDSVLRACLESASRPERIFSLHAPTGAGKTLAAPAFAIERAVNRPGEVRRVITAVPYLSIIDQTASVYTKALGSQAVLEHHSGDSGNRPPRPQKTGPHDDPEDTGDEDPRARCREAIENWNAPFVVTTSVRFFESLFSNRPADLRRLHNIARSVVVLDEVQTLPRRLLAPLLDVMQSLAHEWQVTFLLCTATQPAFERQVGASDEDQRWQPGTITEILPDPKRLFDALRRVSVRWPQPGSTLGWQALAERMAAQSCALAVVNTRKHALQLYTALKAESKTGAAAAPIYHLSTRMCPAHRLSVIETIRDLLARPDPSCLVASTQLIEAGVDLDFPSVFRAFGPLDSIVQAAGRCDREGRLTAMAGQPAGAVTVFVPEDERFPPGIYAEAARVTRALLSSGRLSLDEPDHLRAYFNALFIQPGTQDEREIQALRKAFDFPAVSRAFRMIDEPTAAVFVPFNDQANPLMDAVMAREGFNGDLELRRALQRYQVGLYPDELWSARKSGAVYEAAEGSDIWLARHSCYSMEVGLDLGAQPRANDYMTF